MLTLILVTAAVLLISALCSLFEAALYAVPVHQVEALAQDKKRSGAVLQKLRKNIDRPIAAILSLNTIANTAGATITGALVAQELGSRWIGAFSGALTLGILLFSEVIPKTIGVIYARPLAPLIAVPLQGLCWLMAPLVWICRLTTVLLPKGKSKEVSDEALMVMARMGLKEGSLNADEANVIQNILSLENKKAKEVMTPRSVMFALDSQINVEEARNTPNVFSYSRIPVFDKTQDDIVGIVQRPKILNAVAEDLINTKLEDLMLPVYFVGESASLDKLLKLFLDRKQHLFVVIDEHAGVAGVITLEDILEEILGKEIVDESDQVSDLRELAHLRRKELLNEQ